MEHRFAQNQPSQAEVSRQPAKVVPLSTSDASIVKGLVAGERWAANALYDRYAVSIERMLRRTLGHERHADLEDLLHEVFVQALSSASSLRDSVALLSWLQTIAARIAYRTMRRRRARSWLWFSEPENVPEVESVDVPAETRAAVSRFYAISRKLPAAEQLVFGLRFVEGMEVAQIADTCEISLSTTKRRLKKAKERFYKLAAAEPELADWLTETEGAR